MVILLYPLPAYIRNMYDNFGRGEIKMQQRLIMCLMLIGLMLYYAIPRLSGGGLMEERIFSMAWLCFAILAAGGNLAALMKPVQAVKRNKPKKMEQKKKRSYSA